MRQIVAGKLCVIFNIINMIRNRPGGRHELSAMAGSQCTRPHQGRSGIRQSQGPAMFAIVEVEGLLPGQMQTGSGFPAGFRRGFVVERLHERVGLLLRKEMA